MEYEKSQCSVFSRYLQLTCKPTVRLLHCHFTLKFAQPNNAMISRYCNNFDQSCSCRPSISGVKVKLWKHPVISISTLLLCYLGAKQKGCIGHSLCFHTSLWPPQQNGWYLLYCTLNVAWVFFFFHVKLSGHVNSLDFQRKLVPFV